MDYFLIVEATSTVIGSPKSLQYKQFWYRFNKFSSKIIYVVVDDLPLSATSWEILEPYQYNAIDRGLRQIPQWNCDDLIIISKIDEIPNGSVLKTIKYVHNLPTPSSSSNSYCRYETSEDTTFIGLLRLEIDVYYNNLDC